MASLLATSVIGGNHQGKGHGGIFLIDLVEQQVRQLIDWSRIDIDWRGRGTELGLRGIAFHEETVFLAASDELFAFNPDFSLRGSWKNPYLKQCHEISVYEGQVFLTSAAYDSILAFDIGKQAFHWALYVEPQEFRFNGRIFDPRSEDGPLMLDKMHLNSVVANRDGMYIAGSGSGGMLHFNGNTITMSATLPAGTHNAQPYREGVLFNDSEAMVVRFASPDSEPEEDRVFPLPHIPEEKLSGMDRDAGPAAGVRSGRGLCVVKDGLIAAGSSPSTVALHDLASGKTALSVSLSTDVRHAIHGLEVWPFD
jgi:hypothetical protein